jgi:MFS family permease
MLTTGHKDPATPGPERLESPRNTLTTRLKTPDLRVSRPTQLKRTGPALTRHSAWNALNYPGFRLYFIGSLISNLGTWMQTTAQVVLVYRLTHSVFAVGFVTSAQFAPSLLLGPWATAPVASRIGGRRMLIATQLASAAIAGLLGLLAALDSLTETGLAAGALATGLLFTFALPVQTAMVPRLVPDSQRDTEAAMAMNSVSYNSGRALAPVVCVAVIATIGFTWAFALNAVSFVIFAATLACMRIRKADKPTRAASIKDGYRAALDGPRILLLLAMVAAVTFADDPVLILGPALASHLHAASSWPGYFLSALGLGTVIGSLRPARDPESLGNSWISRTAGAAGRIPRRAAGLLHGSQAPAAGGRKESLTSRRAAAWLFVLSASVIVFATGISAEVSLLAAFIAGFAALNTGAVTQSQLVRTRPRYAASVMALWAVCWAGMKPLASLADGWLASHTHHLWMAAIILNLFPLVLVLAELCLPVNAREAVRKWLKHMLPNSSARLDQKMALQQQFGDRRAAPAVRESASVPEASLETNVPVLGT